MVIELLTEVNRYKSRAAAFCNRQHASEKTSRPRWFRSSSVDGATISLWWMHTWFLLPQRWCKSHPSGFFAKMGRRQQLQFQLQLQSLPIAQHFFIHRKVQSYFALLMVGGGKLIIHLLDLCVTVVANITEFGGVLQVSLHEIFCGASFKGGQIFIRSCYPSM